MRKSLLLLSSTEVLFYVFFSLDYTTRILICTHVTTKRSVSTNVFGAFINLGSDCFLCTRNWCNVLITAARMEVVIRPLRVRRCFTHSFTSIFYCVTLFITFLLSLFRSFYDYVSVCTNTLDGHDTLRLATVLPLMSQSIVDKFESYGFFIIQTTVPVLLVLTMSVKIALRISPCRSSPMLDVNSVRRKRQSDATCTILLLATSFLCCQMPCFIFVLLQHFTNVLRNDVADGATTRIIEMAQFAADLLLLVDSITSIMIYSLKLSEFRRYLMCTIQCVYMSGSSLRNTSLLQNRTSRRPRVYTMRTQNSKGKL